MFFNALRVFGILFLSFNILSCQKFLNDPIDKPKTLQVELDQLKCLNQVGPVFSAYFQSQFNKPKWDDAWKCLDQAVVEFMNGNKGEKQGTYLSSELKHFFKKLFAKVFKKEITDELVDEILKLKYSLLGGEIDQVTRFELERMRSFFVLLAREMELLTPYLPVLLFQEDLNIKIPADKSKVDLAIDSLRAGVTRILTHFKVSGSVYTLPEVKLLVAEVQKFVQNDGPLSAFNKWSARLPFLEKLRAIFIGTQIEIASSKDVERIWLLLVDVFKSALYYSKGVNKAEWSASSDFEMTHSWVESNLEILLATYQWKKKQEIPFTDLDYIVDELSKEDFWPKKLSADTFKLTYRRFVSRILDVHHDDRLTALSYDHILQLRREYQTYVFIQKLVIDELFNSNNRAIQQIKVSEIRKKFGSVEIKNRLKKFAQFSLGSEKQLSLSWQNFLKLLGVANSDRTESLIDKKANFARLFNSKFQLEIVRDEDRNYWQYRDLWVINIYRWTVQALMSGFIDEPKRQKNNEYMTLSELEGLYTEFLEFCQEMGIFDERTKKTWERSQKEADLFTPEGNGDNLIQFVEMADLFAMMYSGGLVSTLKFQEKAANKKFQVENRLDIFNNHFITRDGFRKILKGDFAEIYPNLPYFANYVSTLKNEDFNAFATNSLLVGQLCYNNNIGIETADLRTLNTVLNYVEDLFSIYDQNRSQGFDMIEVEKAYGRFADFIINITKQKVWNASTVLYGTIDFADGWESAGLRVFKYLIFNGRAPAGSELVGFVWDDVWDLHDYSEANRGQILKVFATLKSEIAKNPPDCSAFKLVD
jgi:hypothetical protein